MYCIEEKPYIIVVTFWRPSDSLSGALCPLVTSLVLHFARKCAAMKFQALNVEPLVLIKKTQPKLVGPDIQNAQRKTGEASPAG